MSETSDRVSEQDRKKIYKDAKYHSDQEDINDKVNSYIEELDQLETQLNSQKVYIHKRKGEMVTEFAEFLKSKGFIGTMISSTITQKFKGKISKSYILELLSDEYKREYNKTPQMSAVGHIDHNKDLEESSIAEQELKQRQLLAITTNSETVGQTPESALNEIYGGKSFNQMKNEAAREIKQDQDQTLQNPKNRVPLLTDIPPDSKEILAEYETMKLTINQLVEDRDAAIEKERIMSKKFNQLRGGRLEEENRRLKVENNNLSTLLSDVDKDTLAKEGYKEIEVFKMDPGTQRLLNKISNESQRTFFLLVHPKTMQIKGAKTDIQMHSIQAKRAAGII